MIPQDVTQLVQVVGLGGTLLLIAAITLSLLVRRLTKIAVDRETGQLAIEAKRTDAEADTVQMQNDLQRQITALALEQTKLNQTHQDQQNVLRDQLHAAELKLKEIEVKYAAQEMLLADKDKRLSVTEQLLKLARERAEAVEQANALMLKKLQDDLTKLRHDLTEANNQSQIRLDQMRRAQNENATLKIEKDELQTKVHTLEGQVRTLQTENETLRSAMRELEKALAALQERVNHQPDAAVAVVVNTPVRDGD